MEVGANKTPEELGPPLPAARLLRGSSLQKLEKKRSASARDFTSLGRTSRRNGSGNAPLNQRECKFDGYYDTSELCNKDKARRTQKSQAEAPGGAEPVRRQPVRPPAVAGAPTLRRGGPGAWLREHGPLRLSP
jgi:hypothetical protein